METVVKRILVFGAEIKFHGFESFKHYIWCHKRVIHTCA